MRRGGRFPRDSLKASLTAKGAARSATLTDTLTHARQSDRHAVQARLTRVKIGLPAGLRLWPAFPSRPCPPALPGAVSRGRHGALCGAERGGQRARAALVPPQPNRWQHTPPFSVLRTKGSLRLLGMATGHSHPNILARLFVARNEAFRRVDVGVKLHGTAFLGSRGVGWPARPGCGGACTAARDCRCGAGLPRLHFPLTLLLLPWLSGASPSSSHSTRPLLLPSLQPICFWQANDLTLLRGASRVRQQQQAVRAWA